MALAADHHDMPVARFREFHDVPECTPHAGVPLTFAVVFALAARGIVLVFNRHRKVWELPGGRIDAGDSPRDTARRELFEEAGCEPVGLEWLGVVAVDDGRTHLGAVYRCRVAVVPETMRNEEIDGLASWRRDRSPEPLGDADRALLDKFGSAGPGLER
jgi:8-oxo-dGTP diphosphatase